MNQNQKNSIHLRLPPICLYPDRQTYHFASSTQTYPPHTHAPTPPHSHGRERERGEIYKTAQTTIPIAPVVVVNMPKRFFSIAKEAPEVAGVISAPFPFPFPFPFPLLCVALLLVPLRFAPGAIGYVEFFLWASTLGQQEAIVVKRRVVLRMEKRIVAVVRSLVGW